MGWYDSIEEVRAVPFEGGLIRLRSGLRYLFNCYWPKENFKVFLDRVLRFVDKSGLVSEDGIVSCWYREERANGSVELKERFFYASLYYLGAMAEYDKGRYDVSAVLAMRASLELGRFDGWREFMAVVNVSYAGRMKGGKVGKDIRDELYAELLGYVSSGPADPKKTWKNYECVVKDFQVRLENFMGNRFPRFKMQIDEFILRSLRDAGEVRDAYLSFKNKKSSN